MDLSTTYLGLRLAHPFMAGASPMVHHLDTVRRLEDGGASAIVMHSLFEEQITLANAGEIHHMDPMNRQFAAALADFPAPERFALTPDDYVEHLRRVKAAVKVPVIASLNGMTTESWVNFARTLEEAGADAVELNMYTIAADATQSGATLETHICNAVAALKRLLKIPVAVKLLPFFTAFGQFARRLDAAGADGLVLFNRFYEPDVDVQALKASPQLVLSSSAELPLRLHWIGMLHGRVRASLAATGGVAMPSDGIKAILVGANAVHMVSAILRYGPAYFTVMREGLLRWMESKQFTAVDELRGRVSVGPSVDPEMFERGQYLQTLQSWPTEG